MSETVHLFYSYSHRDEELKNALETHLSILKRQGITIEWHDRKIVPGQRWEVAIDAHLEEADIVLLLISPDFIASDYCYGRELSRALERHEAGNAQVLPIILRPVDWTGAPFAKFQALPKDAKPVTTWANQDEAWVDVAKGVRRATEAVLSTKSSMATTPAPTPIKDLVVNEFSRIESLYERPSRIGGASTGFHTLDRAIDGIHKADIILLCGRPSMGKTDLALNIAVQFAIEAFSSVGFFSMRLSREQVMRRLLVAQSRVSMHRLVRGLLRDSDWQRLTRAAGAMAEMQIYIDAATEFTENELALRIGKVKDSSQLGLVVVDGAEHLKSTERHSSKSGEVRAVVKALRKITVDHQVSIVLTATTAGEGDLRMDKRPMLIDLEDWEPLASDAADVVLILFRPDVYWVDDPNKGTAEVIGAKNAYGHTETLRLAYFSDLCSFENLVEEQ